MQVELTKELTAEILEAATRGDSNFLRPLLLELHPADLAEILDLGSFEQALFIYNLLDASKAAETLVELDEDIREKFLESLTSKEIAEKVIDQLETDDAADVIGELPDEQQEEVIAHLEDQEQADDIQNLLSYGENTAGGLMATELVKVNIDWDVETSIREMRKQAEDVRKIYTIYVVDDNDILLGRISLKALLFYSQENTKVRDLYQKEVKYVTADQPQEEVASRIEKYDLVVIPVIDDQKRLLGRITVDDVVDVIREESEKDYQMASGISENVESSDTVWILSRARLPWLLVGMLGGILGALVISRFEGQLELNPTMAFFIPLIAAMGGNVGVQSSAIVVQGLANKSLELDGMAKKLFKEFLVGLLNGLICSALILGSVLIIYNDWTLGLTVCMALYVVILFAAVFGTFIPLVLERYKIDPALATGPFITTINDVLGLFIYFMIGHMMYGL